MNYLNLAIIGSIIFGVLGFFSFYVAFELKKDVFGVSPDSYVALGFAIIIGLVCLLPISCLIPNESKNLIKSPNDISSRESMK